MKRILLLFLSALILSCDDEAEFHGEIHVYGYCYDMCQARPLEGAIADYRHHSFSVETYSGANGYFEIDENYSFVYNPRYSFPTPSPVFINDSSGAPRCNDFGLFDTSEYDVDTIFFNQSVFSILTVKIDTGIVSSDLDTVFVTFNEAMCGDSARPLSLASTKYYYWSYHKHYVGPFQDNQILDTVQTWVAPYTRKSVSSHSTLKWAARGPNLYHNFSDGFFFTDINNNMSCGSYQVVELELHN